MNYSTYRFTLDIHQTRSQVSIPVMYQDTWVQLFINLTDGGKPYKIGDGCTAVLYAKKADGTALVNECEIIENTRIVYTFNEQTATCIGSVGCEIRLYSKDGLQLTTPSFVILVEERVIKDDEIIESEAERSLLDRVLSNEAEREETEAERKASEDERQEAEAFRQEEEAKRREEELKRQDAEVQRQEAEKERGELPSWMKNSIESLQERIDSIERNGSSGLVERIGECEEDVDNLAKRANDIEAKYKAADDDLNARFTTTSQRVTRIDENYVKLSESVGLLNTRHWEQDSRLNEYRNRITTLENAKLAQQDYVDDKVSEAKSYTDNRFDEILGDGATEALDGIAELARALGEDKNFAASTAAALANKADAAEVNVEINGIKNVLEKLNAWYESSTYVPLKWTKAPTVTPSSLRARGESIASVTVSWGFSRTPETLTVAGVSQTDKAITSFTPTLTAPITWDNTSINKWTISGSVTKPDGTMDTLTATTSPITFGNYSFSGYTTEKTFKASTHASESMQTSSNLNTSKPTSFSGEGMNWIYLYFPARYGIPTGYKYNGFVYEFEYLERAYFTNKHGYGEDYLFIRTTQTLTSENRTLEIVW